MSIRHNKNKAAVKVTNIGDRPVDRLGHRFYMGETKEVELKHTNDALVLAACRFLEVEEIEEPQLEEKPKKLEEKPKRRSKKQKEE